MSRTSPPKLNNKKKTHTLATANNNSLIASKKIKQFIFRVMGANRPIGRIGIGWNFLSQGKHNINYSIQAHKNGALERHWEKGDLRLPRNQFANDNSHLNAHSFILYIHMCISPLWGILEISWQTPITLAFNQFNPKRAGPCYPG